MSLHRTGRTDETIDESLSVVMRRDQRQSAFDCWPAIGTEVLEVSRMQEIVETSTSTTKVPEKSVHSRP